MLSPHQQNPRLISTVTSNSISQYGHGVCFLTLFSRRLWSVFHFRKSTFFNNFFSWNLSCLMFNYADKEQLNDRRSSNHFTLPITPQLQWSPEDRETVLLSHWQSQQIELQVLFASRAGKLGGRTVLLAVSKGRIRRRRYCTVQISHVQKC